MMDDERRERREGRKEKQKPNPLISIKVFFSSSSSSFFSLNHMTCIFFLHFFFGRVERRKFWAQIKHDNLESRRKNRMKRACVFVCGSLISTNLIRMGNGREKKIDSNLCFRRESLISKHWRMDSFFSASKLKFWLIWKKKISNQITILNDFVWIWNDTGEKFDVIRV